LTRVPTEIGNAVDLNDLTTSNLYIQSSNAEAAAGTNYPAPYAGILEVVARGDAAFIYQRYTTYQPYNIVYHRSKYTSTWSGWKEVSTSGHNHDDRYYSEMEVDDLLASKSDDGHLHDGTYLKLSETSTQNLSGAIDLNNNSILGVNAIQLEDNGPTEGFLFPAAGASASGWKIVETDSGLTANNVPGDIQFVAGSTPTRKVTIDTNGAIEAVSTVKGTQLISTTTTPGQPPLTVASTVNVPNLNADMLDGQHASAFAASSHTHTIANITGLQAELDSKLDGTFPTGNRVLVTTAEGDVATSGTIDTTELGYLNGVTSNIQTQLNDKADDDHLHTGVYSPVAHTHDDRYYTETEVNNLINGKENEALFKYEDSDTLKMSSISTSTTASIFGTNGLAVEGSTTYFVEGVIFFTAGVVGTSATHSLGWGSPSGAATVTRNSIYWDYNSSTTGLTLAAATSGVKRTGSTTFQPLNTITMTGTHLFRGAFTGLITFNAAGNFTPRLTVTPTSASVDLTVNQGSFIKLTKVATGSTLTNGTWA
jgi:hypothetical protein